MRLPLSFHFDIWFKTFLVMFFFFFSSRRRHTRCYRDWSSDVCSSDLAALLASLLPGGDTLRGTVVDTAGHPLAAATVSVRSEERRVGKECRSRWSPYH